MKTFCLKSSTIYLVDERMIIDTERKALRKYNESACLIISQLDDGPVTFLELQQRILDTEGNPLFSANDISEFLAYLEQSNLLVLQENED